MTNKEETLLKVRAICLALPEGKEVEAWSHPTFRAGEKMFAAMGDNPQGLSLCMKMTFDCQEELLQDKRFFPSRMRRA